MLSDIEIARSVKLRPINEVAEELGLKEEQIENYGRYIAKVETGAIDKSKFAGHHLILVTAISPTRGERKTKCHTWFPQEKVQASSIVLKQQHSSVPTSAVSKHHERTSRTIRAVSAS